MTYGHMCICDVEPLYLRRLASYLKRHPGFRWRVKTSTDLGLCLKEMPEVLLVSGRILEEYSRDRADESVLNIVGCQIILLLDDSTYEGPWPEIEKYQSAKKLYEDLLEIFGGEVSEDTEIIGIYGPASGPDAEHFAMKMANERLKDGEVLLISLTDFSTFPESRSDQGGLGEWFYYQMQKQEGKTRISDWVYSEGDMDYLRGFRTIYDRMEVKLSEWHCFYRDVLRKSRYGTVLIVFDRLPEHMELFMWCDWIYVRWGQDGFEDFRKQEFKKMTAYMEMDELMDKIMEDKGERYDE